MAALPFRITPQTKERTIEAQIEHLHLSAQGVGIATDSIDLSKTHNFQHDHGKRCKAGHGRIAAPCGQRSSFRRS